MLCSCFVYVIGGYSWRRNERGVDERGETVSQRGAALVWSTDETNWAKQWEKKGRLLLCLIFFTLFCPQIMSDYRRCCSVTARSANFCCTLTPSRHLQLLFSPSYSTNGYEGQLYVLQTSTSGSWSIDEFKQLWPTLVCFSILLACQLLSVVLAHRFPSEDIKQVINLYF